MKKKKTILLLVMASLFFLLMMSNFNAVGAEKNEKINKFSQKLKPISTKSAFGTAFYPYAYIEGTLEDSYNGEFKKGLSFSSATVTGPMGILVIQRTDLFIGAIGILNREPVEEGGYFSSRIILGIEPI